jgi:hypothetical protein
MAYFFAQIEPVTQCQGIHRFAKRGQRRGRVINYKTGIDRFGLERFVLGASKKCAAFVASCIPIQPG